MPRPTRRHASEAALRALALAYPESHEDFPWGHRAIKVRGKAFVFMSKDEDRRELPRGRAEEAGRRIGCERGQGERERSLAACEKGCQARCEEALACAALHDPWPRW
jgi:hypothetical protein